MGGSESHLRSRVNLDLNDKNKKLLAKILIAVICFFWLAWLGYWLRTEEDAVRELDNQAG